MSMKTMQRRLLGRFGQYGLCLLLLLAALAAFWAASIRGQAADYTDPGFEVSTENVETEYADFEGY